MIWKIYREEKSENARVIDFEHKLFPDQLQCAKCGKRMSKEAFHAIRKCPECGCGIMKAVQD